MTIEAKQKMKLGSSKGKKQQCYCSAVFCCLTHGLYCRCMNIPYETLCKLVNKHCLQSNVDLYKWQTLSGFMLVPYVKQSGSIGRNDQRVTALKRKSMSFVFLITHLLVHN